MATHKGNAPVGNGWNEFFGLRGMYGANEWLVFGQDTDPTGRYLNIKLFSDCRVENKANYWMSWDKQKNRLLSRGLDAKLLKENRPDLYKLVVKNLESFS